jgi:phenylacetate-CoA ligase
MTPTALEALATAGSRPRSGYSVRAPRRPAPLLREVSSLEVALSTARKLVGLWTGLARERSAHDAFVRFQERRLRQLLADAERHVPLYAERFAASGVGAAAFRTLSDLTRFPILEKDEVRDRFPEGCLRRGVPLEACRVQQTSGSSGRCMEIALSLRCDDARNLFSRRIYGWNGFRWHNRVAYLFPYRLPFENNLAIYRNVFVDARQEPEAILRELERIRPVILAATPSDVLDLLDGADASRDLRRLGLRALCLHSEPMSPDERAHFAERFGCAVRTNYYCNEVWAIAAECAEGSLHEFMDNVVLELVDDAGAPVPDGSPGHVIVTGLHNYVQPFIRYRLGDVAVRRVERGCGCGRELPILERVEGRDDDFFQHPDGRRVRPSKITVAMKSPCFEYPGLQVFRDYQIVQDAPDHVSVLLVPGRDRGPFPQCARRGARNLERLLAPGVRVRLHVLESLEGGSGGKRKIFARAPGACGGK